MNIVICDDEEYVVRDVRRECELYVKTEDKIECFLSSEELRKWLVEEHPAIDLFILDIEMPEMDGLQLKKLITELYEDTNITFLTVHEEMMEEAFGKRVIGFLRKENFQNRLGELIQEVRAEVERNALIQIKEGKIIHNLPQKRIISVCAERVYSVVTMVSDNDLNENKMYRISLKQWEEILEKSDFFRINRSCIVHFLYVKKITDKVIMENGTVYNISAGKKTVVRKAYRDYCEKMARCL